MEDFNSLDWWVWNSEFRGCARGLTNEFGAGHFHVYDSAFVGSTVADMTMVNTSYFGIRRNVSLGSKAFFVASSIGNNAAPITLAGNLVAGTLDRSSVRIGNLGLLTLLDNTFRADAAGAQALIVHQGPSELAAQTATLSMGNRFSTADAISTPATGGHHSVDDVVVAGNTIVDPVLTRPVVSRGAGRSVIEVPAGAPIATLEAAIGSAVASGTKRPIVHLAAGTYAIGHTLEIPAGADVQIVGDGHGASLSWVGADGGGPVLHLATPARATLRDLTVDGGGKATAGILVDHADQELGRVFADNLLFSTNRDRNLWVDRIGRLRIELRALQGYDGEESRWMQTPLTFLDVQGNASAGSSSVLVFGGLFNGVRETVDSRIVDVSSGGRLLVQDAWYEGFNRYVAHLRDTGELTWDGGLWAYSGKPSAVLDPDKVPIVIWDGSRGMSTLLGVNTTRHAEVIGMSGSTDLLTLGTIANNRSLWIDNQASAPSVRSWAGYAAKAGGGQESVPDVGAFDVDVLRLHLERTRQEVPEGVRATPANVIDLRLERVQVRHAFAGIHISPD